MGFDLGINFDKPYRSASITEFWRRWHISLSSWLRDYLYIPLGGNRRGRVRTYLNLLLTMLIGGLWHGASWRFVVWGGLHGMALAVHRVLGGKAEPPKPLWRRILGWFITFHFVLLMWVFFRAKDFETAMQVFAQLRNVDVAYAMPFVEVRPLLVGLLGIGYGLHFMPMRWVQAVEAQFIRLPWGVQLIVFILTVQLILQMRQAYVQPFIYFQF
jgi:D-alanyl-lipoteichoic acid acyltransferase DltB (MBOAT superfamily)